MAGRGAAGTRKGSRAAIGVTQGEMLVAKFFARKDPGAGIPRTGCRGRPVVEEADAEEMVGRLRDWDGSSDQAGLADIKR